MVNFIAPGEVGKVSVKAPPVNAIELGFVSVKIMVDVPPLWIVAGVNDLLMVGAAITFR